MPSIKIMTGLSITRVRRLTLDLYPANHAPEFRTFVEHTENELLRLFNGIDRDKNGQIDKDELRSACAEAGLIIPQTKLDEFFKKVDTNHDGVISFDEWR